jgi:hypothetical protein
MASQRGQGEPFGHLPPPDCDEELKSRDQIGPAILLYRALQKLGKTKPEALQITQAIVVEDGIRFLRRNLGTISPAKMAQLAPSERQQFVESRGKRFFNATIRWDRIEADEVQFTVTACRFPRLCEETGVPELATAFCMVDAAYFGNVEPGVTLDRSETIAEGASTCPFILRQSADKS